MVAQFEERAAEIAARAGVEQAAVERLPWDLTVFLQDGILVNVDGHGFSRLAEQLDWEALGVRLPKRQQVAFGRPRVGLLPDKYRLPLQRPEGQARAILVR